MLGKSKPAGGAESRTRVGTLIGEGAVFNGDLSAPEAVRVDGTVNGNLNCQKELIIGPSGQIKGNVSAQNVVISGAVEGDMVVSAKLEILSTGRLKGNITARSLVIDENACFDGRCTMDSGSPALITSQPDDADETQESTGRTYGSKDVSNPGTHS